MILCDFKIRCNKVVIKLFVMQFWSEIILVISNQTHAAHSFDFEITRMISDQIALHSVQLPLFIIPHIDSKAQFYCRKTGDDLYFAIFLPDT